MTSDVGTQLRKGAAEYCVLGLLSREPMYGWQLSEHLIAANMIASIGTLYPLLARLRTNGLVVGFEEPSDTGPIRKYYRLTDAGAEQLNAFRAQWHPFAAAVQRLIGRDET